MDHDAASQLSLSHLRCADIATFYKDGSLTIRWQADPCLSPDALHLVMMNGFDGYAEGDRVAEHLPAAPDITFDDQETPWRVF